MFKLKARQIRFKDSEYLDQLHLDLSDMMNEAIRAFVIEVLKRIPVYTGMAQGTLLPVNRIIKLGLVIPTRHPLPGGRIGVGSRSRSEINLERHRSYTSTYEGRTKSPSLGAAYSRFYRYYRKGTSYTFGFSPGLSYFSGEAGDPNDEAPNPKTKHPPWFALENGMEIAAAVIESLVLKYSRRGGFRKPITDFIEVTEIRA